MSDLILIDIIDDGDKRTFRHGQIIGDILNENAEMRKNEGWNGGGGIDMRLAARMPLVTWEEWERMGITEDPVALRRAIECHQEYKTTTKKLI